MIVFFAGIVLSYLCGALPFGIIVTRIVKGVDVRKYGSGSSGFTNVYRVAGIGPGLVVALLDITKGFASVIVIASSLYVDQSGVTITQYQIICGCCAVLGHIFTLFAGFKGGKGVLVTLGVCIGLIPMEAAIALLVFAIVFAISKYISAGSLVAVASLPVMLLVERFLLKREFDTALLLFSILLAVVIFYAHRENIGRLIRGEENRFRKVDVK